MFRDDGLARVERPVKVATTAVKPASADDVWSADSRHGTLAARSTGHEQEAWYWLLL